MVGECMGELLINHEAVDFPEKLLWVTISSEKSSDVWRASVTMATQFLLLPPVTETSKTRHNTQSTQSLISKWKGNYVVSLWEKQLWNVKWCKIGHNWTYFRVQAERLWKTNGRQTPFCSGGDLFRNGGKKTNLLRNAKKTWTCWMFLAVQNSSIGDLVTH